MKRPLALTVLLLLGLSGCGIDLASLFNGGSTTSPTDSANLEQFASDAELKAYLVDQSGYGTRAQSAMPEPSPDFAEDNSAAAPGVPSADGAGSSADSDSSTTPGYSTTTEQEEGVQEADIVKSDGDYIYVLTNGALRIVKAQPAAAMAEVGSLDLEGWGAELFLVGDRVVAITNPADYPMYYGGMVDAVFAPGMYFPQPQTLVSIIDVSDRTSPTVDATARIDGSVVASRMIDDRLYLVTTNYLDIFYVTGADATAPKIDDVPLSDILPDITVTVGEQEMVHGDIARATDHFRPEDADGLGLTNILSIDINDPAAYHAQSVVGYPANVYASLDALYLTNTEWRFNGDQRETTSVYKFAFTDQGATLAASGLVPGRVLNQYSMSERNGYLRLATTIGPTFDSRGESVSQNAVYVLQQNGEKLEEVGSVEGLAPGEQIYSARFIGDKGYLVTFRQIDPLFTIDLSDPREPRAVGQLKVPGFSTFIMPMDENHLLTIGRDTNDFGFADGVRLSIFDVTDFANPQLDHFEVIGTNGAWSEAIYNPKAFTYFAEQDLIAFPLEVYSYRYVDVVDVDTSGMEETHVPVDDVSSSGTGQAGDATVSNGSDEEPPPPDEPPPPGDIAIMPPVPTDYFVGLAVYRATADAGFEPLGRIDTARAAEGYYPLAPSFTRGLFIGDAVYAVTSDGVSASATSDVETALATVDFPTEQPVDDVPIPEPAPTDPGKPVPVTTTAPGQ